MLEDDDDQTPAPMTLDIRDRAPVNYADAPLGFEVKAEECEPTKPKGFIIGVSRLGIDTI